MVRCARSEVSMIRQCSLPVAGLAIGLLWLPTAFGSEFLYAPSASGIYGFSIDSNTGALTPVPGSPFQYVGAPKYVNVVADPAGWFLYGISHTGYFPTNLSQI